MKKLLTRRPQMSVRRKPLINAFLYLPIHYKVTQVSYIQLVFCASVSIASQASLDKGYLALTMEGEDLLRKEDVKLLLGENLQTSLKK